MTTLGLWIAAGILLLCRGLQAEIRLQAYNDHRVTILHSEYQAEWQIRLPEAVGSQEGFFLTHITTPMEWKEFEPGVRGYDWQPTPEYAREAFEKTSRRIPMIVGLRISPRMKIGANRIDLWLHLKNVSEQPFKGVFSDGGCLQHRTERFFDDRYEKTYILTDSGMIPLNKTDRSKDIRAVYFFNLSWFEETGVKAYEYFWGRSQTRPNSALVASEAREGTGAIGIAWDQCFALRQNSDASHHCMHSSPYYGEIKPNQTKSRHGVIFFGKTIQDIVKKFNRDRDSLSPYLGLPGR